MVVIFDCNIWVTLTINSRIDYIADLSNKGVIVAACANLRDEITTVLSRPKFNKFISASDISDVIKLYDLATRKYNLGKIISVTSDAKDDYLFALASKSKADYLVTGDKLLLRVVNYKKTEIISLNRFKEIFR